MRKYCLVVCSSDLFFQAEDGIRDRLVTGVQTCALPIFNSRHLFYGLALLNSFGNWGFRKLYLIFGLTDEVYSLMSTIEVPEGFDKSKFYFLMTLFSQSYWVLGCTIGAWTATQLTFNTQGMEFAATDRKSVV